MQRREFLNNKGEITGDNYRIMNFVIFNTHNTFIIIIIIIIIIMPLLPFVVPWLLFQFLYPIHNRHDFLDDVWSRRKAATYTQNNINREWMHIDIHALCGIRTHDSTFRTSEDSSCPSPRGHCERHKILLG
jgi:hypothetical protein